MDLKLYPLTFPELGSAFNIEKCLQFGSLPGIASKYERAVPVLSSYLSTYLQQELLEETLIRNLNPFRRFIEVVGQFTQKLLNKEKVARESSVKGSTIDHYFEILEGILVETYIRSWNPDLKSKESAHPKCYLFDPGIARTCAGLLNQELESELFGFTFETLILGQIHAYLNQTFKYLDIFHYSITQSYDIDLISQT